MEIKYEPVFGPQELFDGAPEDAEAVGRCKPLQDALVFYKFSDGEFQYKYEAEIDGWKVSTCKHPQSVIKAMRRIIKAPTWTVEDQKAGKLPEVGCLVREKLTHDRCGYYCIVIGVDDGTYCIQFDDGSMRFDDINGIEPIETPAEKAQREEDEFVSGIVFEYDKMPSSVLFEAGIRAAYRKLKGG